MNRIISLTLFAALLFSTSVSALEQKRTVFGKWKTIDDITGEARTVVELYEQNGKLYGKIVKLFPRPGEDVDPVCDKCEGENKNKKKVGMVIINGLTKNGEQWDEGEILDPDSGEYYDCKLWLENGKLSVRGYMLFFFRTQTWLPFVEMNEQKKLSKQIQPALIKTARLIHPYRLNYDVSYRSTEREITRSARV